MISSVATHVLTPSTSPRTELPSSRWRRARRTEEGLKEEEVSQCFKQVSQGSACGPHEVLGAVLKHCHVSLVPVGVLPKTHFRSSSRTTCR